MTLPRPTTCQVQMHAFRPDWKHSARQHLRIQYGCLAVIAIMVYLALKGSPPSQDGVLALAALYAFFAATSLALLYRIGKDVVVLTIGPEGVSFPIKDIGPIDWSNVQRISVVRFGGRVDITALRFHFKKGQINRRQFGSIHKDRWEIIFSIKGPFGIENLRIEGGADAMLDSVERYAVVEGR